MQSSLYVALSAQLALQKRMDTVAHNVANASTPGFKAEEAKFEAVLSPNTETPMAFASPGDTFIKPQAGAAVKTDNPFDVAVRGDAWFAIETPAGRVYTRDGRLQMTPQGDVKTVSGYPILDVGGAGIQLDPQGGPPSIGPDGAISQGGTRTGTIGLFRIPADAKLTRFDSSGVIPDRDAAPMLDFASAGVVQGYVEGANVSPLEEISHLITIQRTFEAATNSLSAAEAALQGAVRSLGSPS
jgi:flagellar basal-body rod protein FlgF